MTPSSELALTGSYPPSTFKNFKTLQTAVKDKFERLDKGGKDQYISLKHVKCKDFDAIDANRNQLQGTVRLTYFQDIETLIIKVPTNEHETATRLIDDAVNFEIRSMNVRNMEFTPRGSATSTGPTGAKKEADASRINLTLRPQNLWPHFVIESGVSESTARLRADAAWWFSNSNGEVKLVLLIKVNRHSRVITIEKWDRHQTRPTRTNPSPWKPRRLRTVELNMGVTPKTCAVQVPSGTATGPALTLEFELLVGRPPVPPLEKNVEFTTAELIECFEPVFP